MIDLDHPVTQKVLATVVAAGVIAWGSVSYQVAQKVDRHELQIEQLEAMHNDIRNMSQDVGEIKTDVRVLEERTRTFQDGTARPPTAARP